MPRTFRPNYLSFAGTYQCNLDLPALLRADRVARPARHPDGASRFLEDAHAEGIDMLGFTGGEPFLYPEFVLALTRRAAELGFRFDKVMTNGVWHDDAAHLDAVLTDLRDAGFTGKLGLSVDKFHGIAHRQGWPSSAASPAGSSTATTSCRCPTPAAHPDQGLEPVRDLAAELDARHRLVGRAAPLPAGRAGPDDDAELEPPGPGRAGGAVHRRLGRRLVRGGLLRGAGPGADRDAARARSSRAAASRRTWTS